MNSKNYFLRLVLLLFVLQIKTAYSQEIWDLVWTNTVTEVSGGSTYTVDISPNQSKVVSGSNNSYLIKIWDAETGNLVWSINTGYGQILKTIFSPDGNTLLIGSNSGIALRNTDYGQLIWSTSAGLIRDVNFSPDGNNVVSAGLDKTIKVWNAQNGNLIWTGIHDSTLKKAVYSPDNTKIASCSNDGVIKIWDAQSGTEIWQGHHSSYIWDVAFSPDGSMVASSGNEDGVKVWDANNGSLLWAGVISGQVESLDFSSDGSRITAISSNGLGDNLFVWNSNTGEVVWSKDTNSGLRDVDYSPDGKKIVTGNALTYTYKVQIWDASDGELLFNGDHSNVVDDVKFSSDSKTVVSASWDNTVKLWKFTKELELSSLKEKEVLKGGTVKELTWTNKNINAINIEFSSDNEQTWTTVIDNLVANTGLYN